MKPTNTYVVCATHRCGSSLLCELLTRTGLAGAPDEYFQGETEQELARTLGPAGYMDRVCRTMDAHTSSNGVFGVKFMVVGFVQHFCSVLSQLPACLGMTPGQAVGSLFPNVRYLFMTRSDKVSQAWSWAKARQTQVWRTGDKGEDGMSLPLYDFDQIEALVGQLTQEEERWHRVFAAIGTEPLTVTYEELVVRRNEVVARILNHLAIPCSTPFDLGEPNLKRLSDQRDELLVRHHKRRRQAMGDGVATMTASV